MKYSQTLSTCGFHQCATMNLVQLLCTSVSACDAQNEVQLQESSHEAYCCGHAVAGSANNQHFVISLSMQLMKV